jgi:hypothetical protein
MSPSTFHRALGTNLGSHREALRADDGPGDTGKARPLRREVLGRRQGTVSRHLARVFHEVEDQQLVLIRAVGS